MMEDREIMDNLAMASGTTACRKAFEQWYVSKHYYRVIGTGGSWRTSDHCKAGWEVWRDAWKASPERQHIRKFVGKVNALSESLNVIPS